jgi:hypothetical protein
LAGPVTVVGSLHGQHVDLLNLFLISTLCHVNTHTHTQHTHTSSASMPTTTIHVYDQMESHPTRTICSSGAM